MPCACGLAVLAMGVSALATGASNSVTLVPTADTSLFENSPDNNLGALTDIPAGMTARSGKRGRCLFKFDIAANLPPAAVVTSAALTLHVSNEPLTPVNSTFLLHRVLRPWGEGHGNDGSTQGAPAVQGDATWNARLYPSPLWSQPGGAAPVDFAPLTSASTPIQGVGNYTFHSSSNLVADLQLWLQNPATNFGWILMSQSEFQMGTARRFTSREALAISSISNNVPKLLVQFVVPLRIYSAAVTNNQFQFAFSAETNQAYLVEFRSTLDPLAAINWTTLTNFTATATNIVVTDALAPDPQRFYRISTP